VPTLTAEELTAHLHAAFPDRRGRSDGGRSDGGRSDGGRGNGAGAPGGTAEGDGGTGGGDGGDRRDGLVRVDRVDDESIRVLLQAGSASLRPGASVSGPTLFTLVDTVAWLMTLARLERGHDALTSAVSMQFLRRPPAGQLVGDGTLLRIGRRSAIIDVRVYAGVADADASRSPVAQATVTYAPLGPVAG
jgi:uncharacterized protein (TIGR00369 family)